MVCLPVRPSENCHCSRAVKLSLLLILAGAPYLAAQQLPTREPAPANAPAAPPLEALTPLPPIERLADEAQRQLFEAAGQPVPGEPTVTTRGRKTVISTADPDREDPAQWKEGETHQLAILEVSFGGAIETVMFVLYGEDAPKTVANFRDNAEARAYDGLAFHRAIEGFIVQTGDPLTADEAARERWGTGGETKTIPAEIKRRHRKGAVAMGRRVDTVNPDRRSNGFQFYFSLGKSGSLDGEYTVFGQVVSGYETLERIAKMPVDGNDCPIARIEIQSLRVVDHKGPLLPPQRDNGDGRKYTKPAAAKGFIERFIERVW